MDSEIDRLTQFFKAAGSVSETKCADIQSEKELLQKRLNESLAVQMELMLTIGQLQEQCSSNMDTQNKLKARIKELEDVFEDAKLKTNQFNTIQSKYMELVADIRKAMEKHTLLETTSIQEIVIHDDVIKWKHFPRNWPFVRGIHRSPVNSPHKGQ